MIPLSEWRWYGTPGHFICADRCRFHLCTEVGEFLVSTVGMMVPLNIPGKKTPRTQYEEVGYKRLFETMVFKMKDRCSCGCRMPLIDGVELLCEGYHTAFEANQGHWATCFRVADKTWQAEHC